MSTRPSVQSSDREAPERLLNRLDWQVLRRLDGILQGDYRSLFMGGGLDFAELREYQPPDDVRHIDWNVTARMDAPYVRRLHGGPRGYGVVPRRPEPFDGIRSAGTAQGVRPGRPGGVAGAPAYAQREPRGSDTVRQRGRDRDSSPRRPHPGVAVDKRHPASAVVARRRYDGPGEAAEFRSQHHQAPLSHIRGVRLHLRARLGQGHGRPEQEARGCWPCGSGTRARWTFPT